MGVEARRAQIEHGSRWEECRRSYGMQDCRSNSSGSCDRSCHCSTYYAVGCDLVRLLRHITLFVHPKCRVRLKSGALGYGPRLPHMDRYLLAGVDTHMCEAPVRFLTHRWAQGTARIAGER